MNSIFTSFRKYLTYFHFLLVGIVLLSWFSKYISDCHLKAEIIYAIKLIIYLSGIILFFIHFFPKRKFTRLVRYFLMYVLLPTISYLSFLAFIYLNPFGRDVRMIYGAIYGLGILLFLIYFIKKQRFKWRTLIYFFLYILTPVIYSSSIILLVILSSFTRGPIQVLTDENYTIYHNYSSPLGPTGYILRKNYFEICQCHTKFISLPIRAEIKNFQIDTKTQRGYLHFVYESYNGKLEKEVPKDSSVNFNLKYRENLKIKEEFQPW